jgi:hypothetical protein
MPAAVGPPHQSHPAVQPSCSARVKWTRHRSRASKVYTAILSSRFVRHQLLQVYARAVGKANATGVIHGIGAFRSQAVLSGGCRAIMLALGGVLLAAARRLHD